LILLGVFEAKLAIAAIAFAGVVLASVYALRLFIRAMHDRVGAYVSSREMTLRDGAVLAPLLAAILLLSLYPQLALHRSEAAVKTAVAAAAHGSAPATLAQSATGACSPTPTRAATAQRAGPLGCATPVRAR
jgi:NADH-quinone oxidoreductase subunit M